MSLFRRRPRPTDLRVGAILDAFGWRWLNVGGIERSRELESLCILWVAIGSRSGSWSHAFTLLQN